MLIHPTLDQLNRLSLNDMARAFTDLQVNPDSAELTLNPGDVVILDNLPAHKGAAAREAVEATGARVLFLPPYSPDFNSIENAFSKLRSCSERPPPTASTKSSVLLAKSSTPSPRPNAKDYFTAAGRDGW